jgi:YVTN family beta-propeller protein
MAELPKGTVTFLFTDIEGSTRLLKQLRDRYAGVLAEHQHVVRMAVTDAGGIEVDTQGDAFFVAFASARDAVAAAVAAQRALAGAEWPDDLSVRVRMGIHTGEPVVGEDRYVGLGVHRAARICSAGHGGQVLLSNTTRELVQDELPSDVHLLDLGEQRLKDIDRPEHLFQLVTEDLPSDFPPLRTVDAEPSDTPFAGREDELAKAAESAVAAPRWSRRRAILIGAIAGAIAVAVAIPVFALSGESGLNDPATGTDSALNVAVRPNSVAVIDPKTNSVVESIPVGSGPGPIAVGEGSVWVANIDDETVVQIDPTTRKVVDTIGVGVEPTDLAVGEGVVWVAAGFDHRLLRIDTANNQVRLRLRIPEAIGPLPAGYERGPSALAVGEGAVWLAHGDEVTRIDPATSQIVDTIRAGGNWSGAIATGEGAVWVVENSRVQTRKQKSGLTNGLVRIDPESNAVTGRVPVPGLGEPGGGESTAGIIGVGAGAVWATVWPDELLWRIDPAAFVAEESIAAGEEPVNIAVDASGVWIEQRNDGTVTRVDPFSNRLVGTVRVGRVLRGIAAGEGAIWVTVRG